MISRSHSSSCVYVRIPSSSQYQPTNQQTNKQSASLPSFCHMYMYMLHRLRAGCKLVSPSAGMGLNPTKAKYPFILSILCMEERYRQLTSDGWMQRITLVVTKEARAQRAAPWTFRPKPISGRQKGRKTNSRLRYTITASHMKKHNTTPHTLSIPTEEEPRKQGQYSALGKTRPENRIELIDSQLSTTITTMKENK